MVILKYKTLKLLITKIDADTSLLFGKLEELLQLDNEVKGFYRNLLNTTDEQAAALEAKINPYREQLGGLGIIGTPLTNHDAELYAINKGWAVEILEVK